MKFCLMAFLILAIGITRAQEPWDPTFDRLAKVDGFAFGPTGWTAEASQGEKDLNAIFSRPSALKDFERLYEVGNLQAKLYALVAFWVLSPDKYKELSHPLRTTKEKVTTVSGCIISRELVADVIKRIDEGQYLPLADPFGLHSRSESPLSPSTAIPADLPGTIFPWATSPLKAHPIPPPDSALRHRRFRTARKQR